MLGTEWTAPKEGDNLRTILLAFDLPHHLKPGDENRPTSLRLTGEPITDYDRQRLTCATVRELGIVD